MTKAVMDDLDLLVESAAVHGQLETGVSPRVIAARSSLGARGTAVLAGKDGRPGLRARSPRWAREEDDFLRSFLGVLSEQEIAEALGRTQPGVRIRWKRELSLTAPSKHPDLMTCNQIANGLGVDGKSVSLLIDRGILAGYRLPCARVMRVVKRVTLLRFLTNPMNWVYFDPKRVGRLSQKVIRGIQKYSAAAEFWAYARRLIKKRRTMWKDEWWRIGQVARHHGVQTHAVNKAIHQGKLQAVDWGNWWVLKSHATDPELVFMREYGRGSITASTGAQAFLVLAEAVGLTHSETGVLMKWKKNRVMWLLKRLHLEGRIPKVVRENGLKVLYDRKTGNTCASWRMHRDRFPRLARLMASLKGRRLSRAEGKYVNRVKRKAENYKSHKNRRHSCLK